MERTERGWSTVCLGVLAVVVIAVQVTFTVDVFRDLTRDYPARPLWLGGPWPTVVEAGGAANAAGLRAGDLVVSIGGRAPAGYITLAQAVRARKPGDSLVISAMRDGRVAAYRVILTPVLFNTGFFGLFFAAVVWILMPNLSIGLGLWVTAVRPRDRRAWLLLGVLLGLSQLARPGILDPLGWPAAVGLPSYLLRRDGSFLWALCMMLFGIYFPQRWRFDQAVPWAKWLLLVPVTALAAWNLVLDGGAAVAYSAAAALPQIPLPNWVVTVLVMSTISVFFVALSDKYRDPSLAADDRRRLRLLHWGCSAAMTPLFLLFVYDLAILHREPGDADDVLLAISFLATFLFPVTMAYVVVVHRALDVRMAVRQGVQYALARRGIRVIQGVLTAAVILFSTMYLDSIKISRPSKFTLIAVGIVVVLRIRDLGERLRRWVDRRFFREAYNAEKILGELSEQVRGILDTHSLLETVVRKISQSLHVERIAVLLENHGSFRPALATGYSGQLDVALAGEGPAVSRLRRLREPVVVDEDTAAEERGALEPLDAQLLLPLTSKKELLGFISLGPKKSEEPYSPSDTSLLRTVAAQTGLALENSRLTEAIAAEVAHREMLNREIEIARDVQQRLFPQNQPDIPALEYAGHCRPAQGVGGDYYDFLALASGRLGLAIGDVSGKGIPAALLMASLQASVRGQSQGDPGHVAELMTNVNRLVCDASPENRYATFFYAQFDPAARRLVYTNGGHNAPMLLRGAEVLRLETGGPPVGLFRPSRYEQEEVQLLAGDLLIFFTDGISEAENPAEEEWGEEALVATVRACGDLVPPEMIARIMEAADAFAAGAPQHDDMTLVVARVLAS